MDELEYDEIELSTSYRRRNTSFLRVKVDKYSGFLDKEKKEFRKVKSRKKAKEKYYFFRPIH